VVLTGPPLVFLEDRCGPGSLSAVLNALADPVTEAELDRELPQVQGGVLSLDLVLVARRHGFDATLSEGDAVALRREIEAGRPVILMVRLLDLPGSRRDVYHYVIVDGFDPGKQLFRFQYGDGRVRWSPLGAIDGSWKPTGRAFLRVTPAVPSLADGLTRGVALERTGRHGEAAELYRQLQAAYPASSRVLVNLGNAEAARGRPAEAEKAYRAALGLTPGEADALNNLAWLLLADPSRLDEAEGLARRAADQPGPDQVQALDSLGRVRLARGRCAEAASAFERALDGELSPAGPLRATLLEGLGQSRLACAEREAARNAFESALQADPSDETAQACRLALAALGPRP
jgi:tetratricopeptide (TPR) repeat protein